jgi:hypothetical protein
MITITIAGTSMSLERITDDWLTHMLGEAHGHTSSPCVRVDVSTPDVQLSLTSIGCGSGGAGRQPNHREQRILDSWNYRGLGTGELSLAELRAFLHELRRLTS